MSPRASTVIQYFSLSRPAASDSQQEKKKRRRRRSGGEDSDSDSEIVNGNDSDDGDLAIRDESQHVIHNIRLIEDEQVYV